MLYGEQTHLEESAAICKGGQLLQTVASLVSRNLLKLEATLKGQNLLPEFFPLRVDALSGGKQIFHIRVISLEVYPFP